MTEEKSASEPAARRLPTPMLVVGLWSVVTIAVMAAGLSPFSTNSLAGSDDYMRFVRVFAWLDGAGWYDQTIARLNAPYGAEVAWSRAVDIPLASLLSLLTPMLGRADAALITASIIPPIVLLGLMFASAAMIRPLVGRELVIIGPTIIVLLPNLLSSTLPGRVDHHAWQLLLMCLALAALARMVTNRRSGSAVLAGGIFGMSLWVGGETVPWLAAANAALALIWIVDGRPIVRVGFIFACAMAVCTMILFPIARDPAIWEVSACDAFSLPTLGLAAAVLVFWAAASLVSTRVDSLTARAISATLFAVAIGGSWLVAFPHCATGPYGDIDPRIAGSWLTTIAEAQYFVTYAGAVPGTALAIIFGPILAVAVGLQRLAKRGRERQERALWIVYTVFSVAALGFAFWQIRVTPFANLFAVPALAWLIIQAWQRIDRHIAPRIRRFAKLSALLSIGILSASFGSLDRFANADSVVLSEEKCDLAAAALAIGTTQETVSIVAAPVDLGAELLFRNHYGIIGAPYHRNSDGIIDSQAIFGSTDESKVRDILAERGARYLIICPSLSEMQLYRSGSGPDTMAERLAADDTPSWLKKIPMPIASGVLAYQVTPN